MSEKQYIKNRRVDDLATAPTPQNTPATQSTLPTPASQAPAIATIQEEDGMYPLYFSAIHMTRPLRSPTFATPCLFCHDFMDTC